MSSASELIKALTEIDHGLTESQVRVVESLARQHAAGRILTARQVELGNKILEEWEERNGAQEDDDD